MYNIKHSRTSTPLWAFVACSKVNFITYVVPGRLAQRQGTHSTHAVKAKALLLCSDQYL
jgi:hypothetical protein